MSEQLDPRSDWRALRLRAGLSLRSLEERTGINRGTLSSIELGRTIPRPAECAAILRALRPAHPGGYPFDDLEHLPPEAPLDSRLEVRR